MDLVPDIFFEKQEGHLCAQHALNALLQGSYFTAVDLATIGQRLDDQENAMLTNQGRSAQQQGSNFDDSGYFSVQVIQEALSVWNLQLIAWNSEEAKQAREQPQNEVAYICNLAEHWFTLRKFTVPWRWYNLNSTQNGPTYLSETYLTMLLQQIQSENYSVFVIRGTLPETPADRLAITLPDPTTIVNNTSLSSPDKKQDAAFSGRGYSLADTTLEQQKTDQSDDDEDDEEVQLAKAIEASLQKPVDDVEEMRRKRLARFGG
ncbi:Josephin-domain-containing protein [Zychaea mexicana]|uniref:Josephin-domain-containing protein n=1 Tax=Zychaea mexicana TaxID=64656 RepID=UPI0022FE6578|nr:Josephin-domain-containing protein [Zychaea mexicana]KAI9490390.1 Josephin-domain-containing protein [Zychaea mexicana]